MTTTEAITELEKCNRRPFGKRKEALDMAIGALKHPECTRCIDCKHFGYDFNPFYCDYLERCVDEDWYCAHAERKKQKRKKL